MMRRLTSARAWAYGLFWPWNIIFLTFMFLGFAPLLLPEMLAAVRAGTIPVAFLVYGAIFAARRLILAAMQRQRAMLDQPEVLDRLHTIALEHSIVTPFSSMIVLVNEEQQRRLDALEQRDDRFQREREDVGETTPEPPTVTGVPEPEEWLLIGLAALMLLWYMRSSRAQAQRRQLVP
jgi:hypothetical protein